MSKVNGQLVTCDRCGKTVFLKTTGDGETDGGFTRWNNFEKIPDGWDYICEIKAQLCPQCHWAWKELIKDFMPKKEEENKD